MQPERRTGLEDRKVESGSPEPLFPSPRGIRFQSDKSQGVWGTESPATLRPPAINQKQKEHI